MNIFKHTKISFIFFQILFYYQIISSNSQLLNRIIRLADNPYRYNHLSFNSEGDMVIDTESYPETKVRKFFGVTKNGKEFFKDNQENKTYYSSMSFDYEIGRLEGESCFIKIQSTNKSLIGKEFLFGVSKSESSTNKIEIYDFIDNNSYYFETKNFFNDIFCHVFSIIPEPNNTNSVFNYYISYVALQNGNYAFYTKKLSFYINNNLNININNTPLGQVTAINQKIVTCFFTDNSLYVCFFINKESKLIIWVFNIKDKNNMGNPIHDKNYKREEKSFYKGIHLKADIGFFAYYKNKENTPFFSLYKINTNRSITLYNSYKDITVSKGTFYNIDMLNDLIKLNNNTVCFISSSQEKTGLNVHVFSLYKNDEQMIIRYYFINIWKENSIKFFCELRLSMYNNFLVMAFSNCEQKVCEEQQIQGYKHFSSLIFFNYPNTMNTTFNVINYIYPDNKNIEDEINFNFKEYLTIENNLFGYIYKGIKFISHSNEINLLIDGNIKDSLPIMVTEGNIQVNFIPNDYYAEGSYIIEFAFILTEPDYGTNNAYLNYTNVSRGNINDESQYFQKYEYIGKYIDYELVLDKNLISNSCNKICSLCYEENKDICVTCKYEFYFNKETNIKTCYNIETEKIESVQSTFPIPKDTQVFEDPILYKETTNIADKKITSEIETTYKQVTSEIETTYKEITSEIGTTYKQIASEIDTTGIINEKNISSFCEVDDVIKGNCHSKVSNDQIKLIYDNLKSHISKNSSEIIETENIIFQISSLHEQKEQSNPNVSSIDLDECEKILKNNSGLSDEEDLIVYKIDIKNENLSTTYVQYEIYNPRTLTIMPLDDCKDTKIKVNIPVNLDESSQSIYDSLSKSGYNLFDLNDDFYNDICATYTSENGTDLTLADRKNIIFDTNGNVSMCQEGCTFQSYNITTKKSQCNCDVQKGETITDMEEINFEDSSLRNYFYNTLNNSNFRVLKCFKLVFSKKGMKNNIGSYVMSGFCLIFIILLLIYIIKENNEIKKFIDKILKQKKDYIPKKEEKKLELGSKFKILDKNKITEKENLKSKKAEKETKQSTSKDKNKAKEETKKAKKKKNKRRKLSNKFFPPKRKKSRIKEKGSVDSKVSTKNIIFTKTSKAFNDSKLDKNSPKRKNILPKTIKIFNLQTSTKKENKKKDDISNNQIKSTEDYLRDYKMLDINDDQMNNLEYEIALIIDKRTYFQYYFSLLKKKQLILFAFYPNNDYNLKSVKITLLILSFSLYFTVNGFFFSDETMNKINKDQGKYKILYQIPQIFYSTVISAIINMILKMLSLSEKQILTIKKEKNYAEAKKNSRSIIKCLKIKIGIFFFLSFLFMLFFWYFISCFCAVYKNTQTILIIDTLISFILSMMYPFGLNLFAGFFRIPALRDNNKKYLYILSTYIALI